MMVSYPLSRGLGNITKVYLITCSQSTCAKLKKYEFCPVGHGGIAHMYKILPKLFKKENITFCFRDTDSIAFKIDNCTYKQYLEIVKNNKQYLNNEMGCVKNEIKENINEIISLRSKCLSIQRLSDVNCKKDLNYDLRKSKGIKNNYRKKFHNHKFYQDVLFNKIKQKKREHYKIINKNGCF